MTEPRIQTFAEFWPYYLREHSNATCRRLHYGGTGATIALAVTALATGNPQLFWALPFVGYGPAWIGHFVFEKNRPATFRYPLWSLLSDFRMFGAAITGRIGDELKRAGVALPAR
jgi:hypothetical protein